MAAKKTKEEREQEHSDMVGVWESGHRAGTDEAFRWCLEHLGPEAAKVIRAEVRRRRGR